MLLLALLGACGPGRGPEDSGVAVGDSGDTADVRDDSGGDTSETAEPPPFLGMHLLPPVTALSAEADLAALVAGVSASRGMLALDPADGPGTARDGAWGAIFDQARASGVAAVGFVSTTGGTRDPDDIERELGRYVAWYEADGAWFSTAGAADCAAVAAYAEAAALADAKDPGDDAEVLPESALDCPELLDAADVVVVANESGAAFRERAAPAWTGGVSAERLAAWVWGVEAADLEATFTHAEALGIGRLYVTDASAADLGARLPSYWSAEVALVAERRPTGPAGAAVRDSSRG